jgi:thioredoxin reductase (NADPH)
MAHRRGQTAAFFACSMASSRWSKSISGHDHELTTFVPGDYFGEVPLLLGTPAVASVRAVEPARVMRLDPRTSTISSRTAGVERRDHEDDGAPGGQDSAGRRGEHGIAATVVGRRDDVTCFAVREFLSRNRVVFAWRDLDDPDTFDRLACDGIIESAADGASAFADVRLPLVILPDQSRLEAPTLPDLAQAVGLQTIPRHDAYDVVIVGGGPAGLAAAVYGASEGLSTLLVERVACGGQAGTSSRIENYLGFPGGLSGDELSGKGAAAGPALQRRAARRAVGRCDRAGRAALARRRGAPGRARRRDAPNDEGRHHGERRAMAPVGTPGIDHLTGRGVYYGASATEALGVRGRTIHLVGGGNSAGQAAMMFSNYAESVTMLVRGKTLAASMSQYLVDQLATKANVTIETEAEVVAVEGTDRLAAIEVVTGPAAGASGGPSDALFVFIGAHAETSWLPPTVIRDEWGYVCAGRDVMDLLEERDAGTWPLERDPYLLETSVPGIFAAGDVRHGSIKRVASSVGRAAWRSRSCTSTWPSCTREARAQSDLAVSFRAGPSGARNPVRPGREAALPAGTSRIPRLRSLRRSARNDTIAARNDRG